jgi:hypothetical protein
VGIGVGGCGGSGVGVDWPSLPVGLMLGMYQWDGGAGFQMEDPLPGFQMEDPCYRSATDRVPWCISIATGARGAAPGRRVKSQIGGYFCKNT